MAGYADACNVFGDPERVGHEVRVLARHRADLGRDPAGVEVTQLTNALAEGSVETFGEVIANPATT